MTIYISNRSTVLSDAALLTALPAFQHYASLVASAWKLKTPVLKFSTAPPADGWQLVVLDDSDQEGALGYHDFAVGGKPIAKVFAKTDRDDGYNWQVTLTHELAEMMVDAWIAAAWQTSNSRFYALEVGDPVEADELAFDYNGVQLSDFVTPNWFIPGAKGPYDWAHHCTKPLQVLYGGYAQYFEYGQWHQVAPNGRLVPMDPHDLAMRTRWNHRQARYL